MIIGAEKAEKKMAVSNTEIGKPAATPEANFRKLPIVRFSAKVKPVCSQYPTGVTIVKERRFSATKCAPVKSPTIMMILWKPAQTTPTTM